MSKYLFLYFYYPFLVDMDLVMAPYLHIIADMDMDMTPCLHICCIKYIIPG